MLISLKNNLHWLLFALGIIFYTPIAIDANLPLGIIWLIFILYTWLITAFLIKQYNSLSFLYAVCICGLIIAVSLFFIKGLEELPFPQGAILFHIDGIALSLLVFFIFSVPLILYSNTSALQKLFVLSSQEQTQSKQESKPIYDTEQWEEASIEDLESDQYEAI